MKTNVKAFFDEATFTVTYVVTDHATKKCAVIDPVLDYDAASGRSSTQSAESVVEFVESNGLTLEWILETHLHADHLTAALYVKEKLGGKIGIGAGVTTIQAVFSEIFNLQDVPADGSHFDVLLNDGATIAVGGINGYVMHTPGHTPACNCYVFGDGRMDRATRAGDRWGERTQARAGRSIQGRGRESGEPTRERGSGANRK